MSEDAWAQTSGPRHGQRRFSHCLQQRRAHSAPAFGFGRPAARCIVRPPSPTPAPGRATTDRNPRKQQQGHVTVTRSLPVMDWRSPNLNDARDSCDRRHADIAKTLKFGDSRHTSPRWRGRAIICAWQRQPLALLVSHAPFLLGKRGSVWCVMSCGRSWSIAS